MPQNYDCLTYGEYWAQRGEDPNEVASRPTPWWQVMGEKKPDPPRRLRRRPAPQNTGDSSPRRGLVRIGARRAAEVHQ